MKIEGNSPKEKLGLALYKKEAAPDALPPRRRPDGLPRNRPNGGDQHAFKGPFGRW